MIRRLIVEEFTVDGTEGELPVGAKYSYFKDPETGKFYRPKPSFVVMAGADLEELFEEVEADVSITKG